MYRSIVLFLVVALFSLFPLCYQSHSYIYERPHDAFTNSMQIKLYGWMKKYKNYRVSVTLRASAKDFFSESLIEDRLKVEINKNIKGASFSYKVNTDGSITLPYNTVFVIFDLSLLKYNETSGIYYGDMSLIIRPVEEGANDYIISEPIAGSSNQINALINENIENFIVRLSSDIISIENM